MKSWDCQYKYKHLNGIWYWYDMIFWKHIQVTCYHFWRSLGLFAPCANLVTFQNSYFNEHRADCKITDEHPMNFGDRYCVKTRWIFKTWWKPGEISRPGENLVNVQNLVMNFQNQVKTWWKPGENLVKTWCKLAENLVKTWWNLGENLVKTRWKLGENLANFENLVKTWWEPGQKSGRNLFENVVQPGEHFLKKPRENLVKTWWKPCEFSQPGDNLMKCHNLGKNLMEF